MPSTGLLVILVVHLVLAGWASYGLLVGARRLREFSPLWRRLAFVALASMPIAWCASLAHGRALVDVISIAVFVLLIRGVELAARTTQRSVDRWGAVLCLAGFVAYAGSVLLPGIRSTELFFTAIELAILVRLFSPKFEGGRGLPARALVPVFALSLAAHFSIGLEGPAGLRPWFRGEPTDLVSLAVFAALLRASMLAESAVVERDQEESKPIEVGVGVVGAGASPLVLFAIALPTVHLTLRLLQLLPAFGAPERNRLVAIYVPLVGALAMIRYAERERSRRRVEIQAEESEDRYRQLLEALPDAIFVVRGTGPRAEIAFANHAGERLTRELGVSLPSTVAELGMPAPPLEPPAPEDSLLPDEVRLRGRSGAREVELVYFPLEDEEVPTWRVTVRDMTEVRRLQREAEQMESLVAMGEFSASVAHEIRNPLASLVFNCHYLDERPTLDDRGRAVLTEMREAADRIQAAVRGVLEFARTGPPRREVESLDSVVESALRSRRERLAEARVEVERSLEGGLRVEVDVGQIAVALGELIDNAVESMVEVPADERILAFYGRRTDEAIFLAVEDSGTGLAPESSEQLMSPFFTTRPDRLGLGLAQVASILEAHGCRYHVDSRAEGGARFLLEFPVSTSDDRPAPSLPPESS